MKAWLLVPLLFIPFVSEGQTLYPNYIPDVWSLSPQDAAQRLVGANVTISNVTFSGNTGQIGGFNQGLEAVGFDEGIVLTTGYASFAGTFGTGNPGDDSPVTGVDTGNDPDLEVLNGTGSSVFNEGILEFDFITTNTSVSFEFTFGSDEYMEYVGSEFNDAFGFFLSGPGISGPFTDNAVNIATIGGDPVSINTVNQTVNSSYFFNNQFIPHIGFPTVEGDNAQLAYDGFTWGLSATYDVQCNQTYHIKLAICNSNDENLDSGVFIKKGTLTSPYGPPGPLTVLPNPVCEGEDLTLTVGGDPDWTYYWSTGQSGVGLQEITTPSSTDIDSYSVTAEYLPGCSLSVATLEEQVVVHDNENVPPMCTGGDFYVQAGDLLNFDIPSSDSPNEWVTIASGAVPAGSSFSVVDLNAQYQTGHFSWQPNDDDLGFYSIVVTVTDNNVCGALSGTCEFNVKVICEYCPICVYYENRSPGGLPLPDLTVAGHCIVAGEDVDPGQTNGLVNTGDASVEFRAPEITLEPGFTAGPGFLAVADPNTCVDDCLDCCDNWTGLTMETPLPNVMSPNGNGVNDFWYVKDQLHPYCAFSASEYELWIFNNGDDLLYHKQDHGFCCPFQAPAPGFDIPHSSIYWDAYTNLSAPGLCAGCPVSDGTYFYILHLESSCGGYQEFTGEIEVLDGPGFGGGGEGMMQQVDEHREAMLLPRSVHSTDDGTLHGTDKEVVLVPLSADAPFRIFPNPASSEVTIQCVKEMASIEVQDPFGRVVLRSIPSGEQAIIDLEWLSEGSYVILVYDSAGTPYLGRVVKQQ